MTLPAEAPAVLLPYQIEAIELSHAHPLFVSEKSRRTGLTYGFAADAVLTASPAQRPSNVYYLAYNKDMTREFIAYCGDFAKAFDAAATASDEFLFDDGSDKGILALRIDFPSGKAIVALSSKPRSLRGMQGVVIIDEAAFHDDFWGVLKAALALLMWGGRVVVISTHDGADNPFNELIGEIRGGQRKGVVQRLTLKDAIAHGLYRRICLRTGKTWTAEGEAAWEADLRNTYKDAAEEELDVVPAKGSGVFLPRATVEACMSPAYAVVRLVPGKDFDTAGGLLAGPGAPIGDAVRDAVRAWREAWIDEWIERVLAPVVATFDPHARSFFGQDFARSSDLSVIACGQEDAQLVLHNRLGIEMLGVPFWAQFRILVWLCRTLPNWSAGKMDARGNGQQLAEDMVEEFGADRIEGVMATQAIYLARMPRLKARFEDRTLLIPRSDGVLDDLRLVKLVRGVPMVVDRIDAKADGAKGKRHGDYAIALMNLVGAADEDVQPIDVHAAGQPRSQSGDYETTDTGFGTVRRHDRFGGRGDW
ncbi:hypothetical protein AVM11_03320 [Sphingomonas melonis TY]|jgi:phage FluMu gp28-like protein|uniref:Uncharacterized protein n=1 Tax=Sphingomonas melonis TY TaxID=621456 RepID=A0A175Y3R8_9SPHN|nr:MULTISPECIES: hypothetical protein [Sphingomonas]AOW22752.1 hypothetical protein BJP26_03510 [Sphingomonas melonis TY]ATI56157.1 hypothetical protein CP552_10805 [Sphingomonas melonis]KZB95317.1 hypothetical protein AVM11_03320 [Sphingomonas melonis TY]MBI0530790.1 hypothetical protein [Sphingomonas sp. TX0522]MBX8845125.1 hypothetical protein [Sphingomonas melonis]